jgi:hypothetical protein
VNLFDYSIHVVYHSGLYLGALEVDTVAFIDAEVVGMVASSHQL